MYNIYATVATIKQHNNITTSTEDDLLTRIAFRASAMWEMLTRRVFVPYAATKSFVYMYSDYLPVHDDLLEVWQLTTNCGATEITEYTLVCGHDPNITPYSAIAISPYAEQKFEYGECMYSNTVYGVWGYCNDYNRSSCGFVIEDELTADIDDTTRIIPVSDTGTVNIYGYGTRFEAQQIIRIDNEFMFVSAVNDDNTLTVTRAVNGTTSSSHDSGAAVSVFYVQPDIRNAVLLLASWLYAQIDSPYLEVQSVNNLGLITVKNKIPEEIIMTAMYYRNIRG